MKNKWLWVGLLVGVAAAWWLWRKQGVAKYGYAANSAQKSTLDRLMRERELELA